MKAIAFIKNNILVAVALTTVIGFSSFKVAKIFQQPEDGWYEVAPDSGTPHDQDLQIIGNRLSDGPEDQCASLDELNPPCAVYLTFAPNTTTSPTGMSVSDATSSTGLNAAIEPTEGNDGYTFQEPQ